MTAAEWRRARALRHIEASAELSALHYGHPAQARVGKLRDRVRAEWYRTRDLRDDHRVVLDRDPTNAELAAANEAKGPTE